MKKFVDLTTGKVLAEGESAPIFGGPWGDLQKAGLAAWLDVPAGEESGDCDVVLTPSPRVVVNAARKAARLASVDTKTQRRARIKAADATTVPPAFRGLIQDLVDEVKELGGFQ